MQVAGRLTKGTWVVIFHIGVITITRACVGNAMESMHEDYNGQRAACTRFTIQLRRTDIIDQLPALRCYLATPFAIATLPCPTAANPPTFSRKSKAGGFFSRYATRARKVSDDAPTPWPSLCW